MNGPRALALALAVGAQVFTLCGPTLAQQTPTPTDQPFLTVELNIAEQHEDACRLTFVAENGLGADISAVVFETVLFDRAGQVIDLTLFDFQGLPAGSPRVRQFDLAGIACTSVGRVLLNDVHACTGVDVTPEGCSAGLRWSSRTDIEVVG